MPGNCSPYKRSSSPNRSELIFCLSCNQETQIQRQHNKIHNSRFWSVYIFTRGQNVVNSWSKFSGCLLALPGWTISGWVCACRDFLAPWHRECHTFMHIHPGTTWDLRTIWICTFLCLDFYLLLLFLCSMNCISAALPEICGQHGYLYRFCFVPHTCFGPRFDH